MSLSVNGSPATGTTQQTGFVPKNGRVPLKHGTVGEAWVNPRPIMSRSAARRTA